MLDRCLGDRRWFKLLFIFYVFTNTLALGYYGIDNSILAYGVVAYALLITIYDLVRGELLYIKNHLLVIGMYGVLLLMATYLNTEYCTTDSLLISGMQLIIFILIFAQPKSMTLKQMKKELQLLIPTSSILVGTASLISLGMYFLNISGSRNGWYIGLVGDRLFGVYFNCNPAAFLAIIVILMSLVAIKNHYPCRILYLINIVIQLTYVVLTQCRAATITLAVICTAVLYYLFFKSKEMSYTKRILLNTGICLGLIFSTTVINDVAFLIPKLQGAKVEETESRFQLDKVKDIVTLTLSGEVKNIPTIIDLVDDVSSGRITLAKGSAKVWKQSPIQGVGAGHFREMLVDVTGRDNWGQQIVHSHNIFIEALVTSGIMGLLLFIIFFIKSIFVSRDVLMKYKHKKSYYIVLLFTMIYTSECIGGFFDFGVFYVYSLSAPLAWLFLGYIYWLHDQPDLSLVDDSYVARFNAYRLLSIQYEKEDLKSLKPHFVVQSSHYEQDDYILRITYYVGHSTFTYDVYYTLYDDQRDEADINNELAREFYYTIKDDLDYIYEQSQLR